MGRTADLRGRAAFCKNRDRGKEIKKDRRNLIPNRKKEDMFTFFQVNQKILL